MKLLIIFILLLFVQTSCSQDNQARQSAKSEKKSNAYTLDLRKDEKQFNSGIDLRDYSQFREVEQTEDGLIVLTGEASFRLFKETADNSWSEIKLSEGIYCLDFLDGKNGWVVDWKGYAWQTLDAGKTWNRLGMVSQNAGHSICSSLQFTSRQTGWLAGYFGLFKTDDGGKNWNKVARVAEDAQDVFFLDQSTGWVVAGDENNNTTIYLTSDGGRSWTSQNIEKFPVDEIFLQTFEMALAKRRNDVFLTNDKGKSWTRAESFGNNFVAKSIFCSDSQTCFVAGYAYKTESEAYPKFGSPVLFKTVNNGQSWSRIDFPNNEHFFEKVKFFNPNFGILAAQNTLYKTTDGGITWIEILKLEPNR